MNAEAFDTIVNDALARLPDWVHEALSNVELIIEDEAEEDLDPDGRDLLGLYVGSPLPERDANHAGELPDVIYIFRRPHLALGLEGAALADEVRKTLMHEIAHFFGFDDDHLEEIGWD